MANEENYGEGFFFKGTAYQGTASSRVKSGAGVVHGVIVGSNSGGSFKFYDGLTAVNAVGGSYTPGSGSSVVTFPVALVFNTGIYFEYSSIAGGAKMENPLVVFN